MSAFGSQSPSSSPTSRHNRTGSGDRFIANRSLLDLDMSHFNLSSSALSASVTHEDTSPSKEQYKAQLARSMFEGKEGSASANILTFKQKAPQPAGAESSMRVLYSQSKSVTAKPKSQRYIPQVPEKILDAPDLLDDYYLNLLDWSSTNMLAVALGQTVYLWNASSGDIAELTSVEGENYITSVSWVSGGNYLAVGTAEGETQLWDAETRQLKRRMGGHSARVSSLSWNNHILSSGGRDALIVNHDVRIRAHEFQVFSGTHEQEICGLRWSPDGSQLASGGNDNLLCVWELNSSEPKMRRSEHTAAVKALAWCPWQPSLLASGGGTSDRKIRFWNTSTGACLNMIDTHSQVCSLVWSKHSKEIVSSHGFSQNQLVVWKYPSMTRVTELTGHTSRVLHMAMSPDGSTVVSAAGDETLRFWKIFDLTTTAKSSDGRQSAHAAASIGQKRGLGYSLIR